MYLKHCYKSNSITHKNCNIMDRKTFIRKTAGALLLAVLAYALLSCSSSSDDSIKQLPTSNNPDCQANGTISDIGNNHGHSVTVSKADVIAGVRKLYNFTGGSHSHMWVFTDDMFTILKGNGQVSNATSTIENHRHPVTISCAVD